jgi:iron(III) transport system permease protein
MPIIALVFSAFKIDETGSFEHLIDTVLLTYSLNTLLLILGVIVLSFIFALPVAWFVACCEFPSRTILQWALMLPLAIPPYIVAIVYTDLLDYSGPLQQFSRAVMGWQQHSDYYFPEIRSLFGAILILSLTLYPYLYLIISQLQ